MPFGLPSLGDVLQNAAIGNLQRVRQNITAPAPALPTRAERVAERAAQVAAARVGPPTIIFRRR